MIPIPQLALWEAHMLLYGAQNAARLTAAGPNYYTTHVPGAGNDDTYYDAIRVFYQMADYTSSLTPWNAAALSARALYRDQYVLPNAGSVQAYVSFSKGLRMDYARTNPSENRSRDAVIALSNNPRYAADGSTAGSSAGESREVAYAITAHVDAEALGAAPRQRHKDLVNLAYGHLAQWFTLKTAAVQPFMVGITAQALIRDWEQSQDARLLPWLRVAAEGLWAMAWDDATQSFRYLGGGGAPDLNLLIAPLYAFLWKETQEASFQVRGDAAFVGGVNQAFLSGGKQFNQNYVWSFDYVTWRTAVAPPPPPPPPPPPVLTYTLQLIEDQTGRVLGRVPLA